MSETIVKNTTPFIDVYMNERDVQIPEDWKVVSLEEICSLIDGDRGKEYPSVKDFSSSGFCLFLDAKNIGENDQFSSDKNKFISEEKDKKLRSGKVIPNDIIITTRGTLGKTIIITKKIYDLYKHIRINSGMLILRTKDGYDVKYFYYALKNIKDKLYNSGAVIPQLTKVYLKKYVLKVPSLKEQERIASYLSNLEYRLNRASRAVVLMETKLRYYSRELLTGRLRLTDSGDIVKNNEWKDVIVNERDVQIPKNWSVENIGDMVVKKDKSYFMAKDFAGGEYPAYTCSEKIKQCHEYNADGYNILLSTGGMPIVNWYNGKCAFSSDVFNIHSIDENTFSSRFISFYLKNKTKTDLKKMFYGIGLKHLNRKEFMAYNVITPPINEQIRIASYLSDIEKALDIRRREKIRCEEKLAWASKALLSGKYVLR